MEWPSANICFDSQVSGSLDLLASLFIAIQVFDRKLIVTCNPHMPRVVRLGGRRELQQKTRLSSNFLSAHPTALFCPFHILTLIFYGLRP